MRSKALALLSMLILFIPMLGTPGQGLETEPVIVEYYWNSENGTDMGCTVYDRPDGILQDGVSLSERVESGAMGQYYLEGIYLATGSYHRGIMALNPKDGTLHQDQPSDFIPGNFGDIVVTPAIYSIKGNLEHSATLFLASTAGNVLAMNATVVWPDSFGSDASQEVYRIAYTPLWNDTLRGAIHSSPSIFYGDYGNDSDDAVLIVSEGGELAAYSVMEKNGTHLLWKSSLNGGSFFSPVPDEYDGLVFVGNDGGDLWCLDAGNGSVLWHVTIEGINSLHISSRYRYSGQGAGLIASTADGKILKISPQNGEITEEITLWDGCPVGGVFITHDGGTIYAGISVIMDGKPMGKGRIYSIDAGRMKIEWYQNTTGNITRNPLYVGALGYVCLVTDAGYFYELDGGGKIEAKIRLFGNSAAHTPLYVPYLPGHVYPAFIVFSRGGVVKAFSREVVYYGSSVEPLLYEDVDAEPLSEVGDSWGYEWSADFSKNNLSFWSYFGNVEYLGGEGNFSRMLFIRYAGEDDRGYRFDYKGGSRAEGRFQTMYIFDYGESVGRVDALLYDVKIEHFEMRFSGSFWLVPSSYGDERGGHIYFGVPYQTFEAVWKKEVNVTMESDSHSFTTVLKEDMRAENFTVDYVPSIPFILLSGENFSSGFHGEFRYSGFLSGTNEKKIAPPFSDVESSTMSHESVSSVVVTYLPFALFIENDSFIPLFPPFADTFSMEYYTLPWSSKPAIYGKYSDGFYSSLYSPVLFFSFMDPFYLNSSAATEEEVDAYLNNYSEGGSGVSAPSDSGFPLLMAGIAVTIMLLLSCIFVMVIRKNGRL